VSFVELDDSVFTSSDFAPGVILVRFLDAGLSVLDMIINNYFIDMLSITMPALFLKKQYTMATTKKKWSGSVTKNSNALDLEPKVFNKSSAKEIATSLKRSAAQSTRKKGTPYQSAMSMLNFYINRAGKNLSPTKKKRLQSAKAQLKKVFHKD
jgi:hypothetical protein